MSITLGVQEGDARRNDWNEGDVRDEKEDHICGISSYDGFFRGRLQPINRE